MPPSYGEPFDTAEAESRCPADAFDSGRRDPWLPSQVAPAWPPVLAAACERQRRADLVVPRGQPGGVRLYVAVDGGFRLALDGPCAVALDAGDAVLLPVAVAHRVTAQHHPSEASLIVVSARFGTSFEPDEAGLARWPLIARGAMSHGVLSFALAAMELEAKEGHAGEAPALTRLADAVVSVFLRLSGPPPARTPARPDRRIAQALRAMHAAPERRWSVADLAEVAHMSRSGFCERFARVVGEAPVAHLASLRMQLAAQWVSATDMTLAEAANRLGYESAASFSRAFKRSHGVSPRDFRDRMRQARRAAG